MFELSLKGRASVCLVKKGKNISGRWKKYMEIETFKNILQLVCSMYERVIDKEAVRVGCSRS